ncbi:MAG: MBL fold metallo-hydrolase [bacterium]|jgi:L-ascorbate metabolism protein UlaG (beta-lactamase superfamily)|nr:MBL fold metallo-hydrolase [candidate division KSB1 bacterium]MDH7560875.1 MBL fold metallo-hydrolase [bacterium]
MKVHRTFLLLLGVLVSASGPVVTVSPVGAQESHIFLHYLGHSSFVIAFDNGIHVLTDYGTSNAYGYPSPIYSIATLRPDMVTYSHRHEDHWDPRRQPDSVSYVLTDFNTLRLGELCIGPVRVAESSVAQKDNSAFIFTWKGFTLVHLGDAQANIMNIANPANRNYLRQVLPARIDLLLMPIEGVNTFIPEAEAFIDSLRPRKVIPMHYWSKQYESEFLAYLEEQCLSAGKEYQIERHAGAKYSVATSDMGILPTTVISLSPFPFSDFTLPDIRVDQVTVADQAGNNNGRADAGETVQLVVTLRNLWVDATNVTASLSTAGADVQLGNITSFFGNIAPEERTSNDANPFSLSAHANASPHYGTFYLDIGANRGYAKVDSFRLVIGTPTVLLVDDDDGQAYQEVYANIFIPDVWEVAANGCPALELLKAHEAVVWLTGDDRKNSLTAEEQSVLAAFLEQGGRLLLCGQNIAYDLGGDGSTADSLFLADYLCTVFAADSCNATAAVGVVGDPIGGGMVVGLAKTPAGEGHRTAPDVIQALPPATPTLKYVPGNAPAGLRYEKPNTGARLVYLAFGVEKVTGPKPTVASELVERILRWLTGSTSVEPAEGMDDLPRLFFLGQNYPNPFNPTTTIGYSLPHPAFVTLKLYNVLGEEPLTLVEGSQAAGQHAAILDGRELPSGVYVYRLRAGTLEVTNKCLLLR